MLNSTVFGAVEDRKDKTTRCINQRAMEGAMLHGRKLSADDYFRPISDASLIATERRSSMCSVACEHLLGSSLSNSPSLASPRRSIPMDTKVPTPMGELRFPASDEDYANVPLGSMSNGTIRKDQETASLKSPSVKRSQFFKTKLCPWFVKGRCFLEKGCNYAHSHEELRRKPDLSRTTLCPMILQNRECTQSRCRYAHSVEELRATSSLFKTRVCKYWKEGFCLAGIECRHAHGEQEIRNPPESPRLGGTLNNPDPLDDEICSRPTITNDSASSLLGSSRTASPANSASDYISSPRAQHNSTSPATSTCSGGILAPCQLSLASGVSSPPSDPIRQNGNKYHPACEEVPSFQLMPNAEVGGDQEEPWPKVYYEAVTPSEGQTNTYLDAFLQLVKLSLAGELKRSRGVGRVSAIAGDLHAVNNADDTSTTVLSEGGDSLLTDQAYRGSADKQMRDGVKHLLASQLLDNYNYGCHLESSTANSYKSDVSTGPKTDRMESTKCDSCIPPSELSVSVTSPLNAIYPDTPHRADLPCPVVDGVCDTPLADDNRSYREDPMREDPSLDLFGSGVKTEYRMPDDWFATSLGDHRVRCALNCSLRTCFSADDDFGMSESSSWLACSEGVPIVSGVEQHGIRDEPQRSALPLASSSFQRPGAPDVASQLWSMPTMGLSVGGLNFRVV